jgi:putative transposase
MSEPFADEIDDADWHEACRKADVIRKFLRRESGPTTVGQMRELAGDLRLSQASAYRLLKLFREGGTVLSLAGRRIGRPVGHRVLDDARNDIIRTEIKRFYLKKNRPSVSALVREVNARCRSAGLAPPHRRTIVARIEDIDLAKRAKARGEAEIEKSTVAVPGKFEVSRCNRS